MASGDSVRYLVIAGTVLPVLAGLGHALLAVADVARPRSFTPVDDTVRSSMMATPMRFASRWTNMWRAWLGFNISHGIGIAAVNLVLLLLAIGDVDAFHRVPLLVPLAAAVAASYFVVAIRFWFFGPAIIAGTATAAYIAAALMLRWA